MLPSPPPPSPPPSGFFFVIREVPRAASIVGVCRKSIQLAGFHGAKPGAIVPGIGIFTTPPPPPPSPPPLPPPPPPRHAGEQPAIITAISVSGIFQPFLVPPFSLPPSSAASSTSTIIQCCGRYREKRTISQKKKARSIGELLCTFSSRVTCDRTLHTGENCPRESATNATQPRVCSRDEEKNYLPRVNTPSKNGPWTL